MYLGVVKQWFPPFRLYEDVRLEVFPNCLHLSHLHKHDVHLHTGPSTSLLGHCRHFRLKCLDGAACVRWSVVHFPAVDGIPVLATFNMQVLESDNWRSVWRHPCIVVSVVVMVDVVWNFTVLFSWRRINTPVSMPHVIWHSAKNITL